MKRKISYSRLFLLMTPVFLLFGIGLIWAHFAQKPAEPNNLAEETSSEMEKYDLSSYLKTAVEPVGKVMYIWGGGWNEEDTGSGQETRQIGLAPNWIEFANQQDASYNYEDHLYEIHNGLDCSGYVGWVLYNTMETANDQDGYVDYSQLLTTHLVDQEFGTIIPADQIVEYEAGDILSNEEHIFIVLKEMDDGSLLLTHSSPPGVRISGTPDRNGNMNSQAVGAAQEAMQKYAADWYAKYPDCFVDASFLTDYDLFRFDPQVMTDKEEIKKMPAADLINYLFSSTN